ncbi:hypothetical protein LTR62_003979 [Meristemomyces frigidus]|uniref:Uncharacterized protein n=1 Tax=Meristemomyces frigidus TaxID=1508187 RepID=A0AAN7TWY1_9PEZI|nr:hypothetical protein LTR62_003979 [Meristemomyces frigidus]
MRYQALLTLALTFLTSLATSLETSQSVDIHTWPLSSTKSQPYAKITYNSTRATITSHNNIALPPNDDLVRIGFYTPSNQWSGILTSAANFVAQKDKKIQLYLNTEGEVYHIGFRASNFATSSKTSNKQDDLSVEVLGPQPGPTVHLDRPVVVNPDGSSPEKAPEKTFLQKYWWAIAGFVVLQVVLSGGKGE